jgi:hypothetical protein
MINFPFDDVCSVTMVHTKDGFLESFLGDLSKAVAEELANPSTKVGCAPFYPLRL